MRGLGKGIREFKSASKGEETTQTSEVSKTEAEEK